jgi:hypothetical protein
MVIWIIIYALGKLKRNKNFNIIPRQLGNITCKRTRHEHFPKIRYDKKINKQKELDTLVVKGELKV